MVLILDACKKHDTCGSSQPVSAYFTISEACSGCGNSTQHFIPYHTDTIFGNQATFDAVEDGAQYEWYIGAATYSTQSVTLSFANAPDGGVIPIQLIVNKTPDHVCHPLDDGIDTLTRYLYIDRHSRMVYGSWYGSYTDSPGVWSTVTISPQYNTYERDTFPRISGLYPYVDSMVNIGSQWDFRREMYWELAYGTFPDMSGVALVDSTDHNIEINYHWIPDSHVNQFKSRTFKGKRI